ncbi:MAG: SPFH domain-containing protein, partial [Clostridiales bacterium]|nr:SPFH domain-containing protein [Clostridiales bacterium]
MKTDNAATETRQQNEERIVSHVPGMLILILDIVVTAALTVLLITVGTAWLLDGAYPAASPVIFFIAIIWYAFPCYMLLIGLKIVKPNEAYVFTLFGKYHGSLTKEGFYFVNPFVSATNPLKPSLYWQAVSASSIKLTAGPKDGEKTSSSSSTKSNKISTKVMTLNNNKQKINDLLGNPIEIGIVVIWRV